MGYLIGIEVGIHGRHSGQGNGKAGGVILRMQIQGGERQKHLTMREFRPKTPARPAPEPETEPEPEPLI